MYFSVRSSALENFVGSHVKLNFRSEKKMALELRPRKVSYLVDWLKLLLELFDVMLFCMRDGVVLIH